MRRPPDPRRSYVMSRIRKTNSGPERELRAALTAARISFRTYGKLPGTPDLVLRHSRLVVFVHGCFWHGCPMHYRAPKSNKTYWSMKLARNKSRDRADSRALRKMGWKQIVIWECQIRRDPLKVLARVSKQANVSRRAGRQAFRPSKR